MILIMGDYHALYVVTRFECVLRCLNLQKCFTLAKIKGKMPNHSRKDAQVSDLAPFFGDLSQIEKLSEK